MGGNGSEEKRREIKTEAGGRSETAAALEDAELAPSREHSETYA